MVEFLRNELLLVFDLLLTDVSVWLHQAVKGYRDKDGKPLKNAHLLGVFFRICKLLNYGIKPVFVFDGGVPVLKRQTLTSRRQRRLEAQDNSEITRQKLLSNLIRSQLQSQTKKAIPPSVLIQAGITELTSSAKRVKSPSKKPRSAEKKSDDTSGQYDEVDLERLRAELERNDKINSSLFGVAEKAVAVDRSDSSDDEGNFAGGRNYAEHFSSITSPNFDTLPLEIQHEILFDMQESKKTNSWAKLHEMPKDLQNFSSFQMDRLVKRRFLQKKIQSVQKEMGNRHIHVQNLDDLQSFEADFVGSELEGTETEIIGSKERGVLMIKRKSVTSKLSELKPATEASSSSFNFNQDAKPEEITIDDYVEEWPGSSSSDENEINDDVNVSRVSTTSDGGVVDDDEDVQLAKAIELSLKEASSNPLQESDDDTKQIKEEGSCQSYQNEREVNQANIGSTDEFKQPSISETEKPKAGKVLSSSFSFVNENASRICSRFLDKIGVFAIPSTPSNSSNSKWPQIRIDHNRQDDGDRLSTSSETDDDDFEEVPFVDEKNILVSLTDVPKSETISIHIDPSLKYDKSNDIFSDLFEEGRKVVTPSQENQESQNVGIDKDVMDEIEVKEPSISVTYDNPIVGDIRSNVSSFASSISSVTEMDFVDIEDSPSPAPPLASSSIPTTSGVPVLSMDFMQAQEKLSNQQEMLQNLMGAQDRIATSITDQMYAETQELLGLFGIPYVISPMEAESQCAFLDLACLTDGSITEDNDIFLFGGRRVYRHFFSQGDKPVEFFQYADIVAKLNLDREKLILLAMLVGSDYTNGIEGVGPVLALEILSEFPSSGTCYFESLIKFREWWEQAHSQNDTFCTNKVRDKLRKIHLRSGFPNKAVYDAYLNPSIDTSTERFCWGKINKEALKLFAKNKFGWDEKRFDSTFNPILKSIAAHEQNKGRQLTMDSFITMRSSISSKRKIKSKRLAFAMKKLKANASCSITTGELNLSESESSADEDGEHEPTPSSSSGLNTSGASGSSNGVNTAVATNAPVPTNHRRQVPKQGKKKVVRIPKSQLNAAIPQKVQEETQKAMNKLRAIEIMKNKRKP